MPRRNGPGARLSRSVRLAGPAFAAGVALAAGLFPGQALASLSLNLPVADWDQASITGGVANGQAGTTLLSIYDFNGDTISDLAVGWPSYPNFTQNSGAVAVFFGPLSDEPGLSLDLSEADLIFTLNDSGAQIGTSLATNDFDADGYYDLAIGAPAMLGGKGVVWIVYGGPTWDGQIQNIAGSVNFTGETNGDAAGTALTAGDFDSDGYRDLVISAPNNDFFAQNGGQVYIMWGKQGRWTSSALSSSGGFLYGNVAGMRLGSSLTNAVNANFDNRDDLVIGAPNASSGEGLTYLVFGAAQAAFTPRKSITSVTASWYKGEAGGDQAGAAVVGVGDVDANGYADFLIGAPGHDAGGVNTNKGKVYLIRGRSSGWVTGQQTSPLSDSTIPSFIGISDLDEAGSALGWSEDVTGDFIPELLIGAPKAYNGDSASDAGQFYLVFGKTDGWSRNVGLGNPEVVDASFRAEGSNDKLGAAFASLGDVDGDNRMEFAVAAPYADGGASDSGRIYIIDVESILDRDDDLVTITGGDCDDDDPTVKPGALEIPYDGIDQNCDGQDDADADDDGWCKGGLEGYDYARANCPQGTTDCNDRDVDAYPGAEEIPYDGIDQSCDGKEVSDVDGDGWCQMGLSDAVYALSTCPSGTTDCNDLDAAISPGAVDNAYDDIDQDCDGLDLTDVDNDGYDGGPNGDDCDDLEPTTHPGSAEVPYDGVDQDCDGEDYDDIDADGFPGGETGTDCDDNNGQVFPGAFDVCDGVDNDCDGVTDQGFDEDEDGYANADTCSYGTDCDDQLPSINPGVAEVCDEVDNNCDGATDEGFDQDGDGHQDEEACADLGGDDCDDSNADVYYNAPERCDGVDGDCDGDIDEDFDQDGDGYPAGVSCDASVEQDCDDDDPGVNPGQEEKPGDGFDNDCDPQTSDVDADGDGYEGSAGDGADCDDSDESVYPGAEEIVGDGIDQDCDGSDLTDADGDGFTSDVDCDDTSAGVHPDAAEICDNGIDDNCDELVDAQDEQGCGQEETPSPTPDETDADADGFTRDQDCDDEDPSAFPGAPELCGSMTDTNCDGLAGEGDCQQIIGGCSCSTGSNPSAATAQGLLALAALALRGLRRRRAVAAACAAALPLSVAAQEAQSPAINHLDPSMDPSSPFVSTSSAAALPSGQLNFGLFYTHLDLPLQLGGSGGADPTPLITRVDVVDLSASVGLTQKLGISVGLPFASTEYTEAGAELLEAESGGAFETARIQLRYTFVDTNGLAVAVLPAVRYPLGALGETAAEGVLAVQKRNDRLSLGFNLGYRYWLDTVELAGSDLGGGVALARAGVSYAAIPDKMWLQSELWSQLNLGAGAAVSGAPTELGVSFVYAARGGMGFTAGGSGTVGDGFGAPRYRGFVGLDFAFGGSKKTPTPVVDADGDGIADGDDACVNQREDLDGDRDSDGCPEEPQVEAPRPPRGKADADQDGLTDDVDKCPGEAEDRDAFLDTDGCPDADNDGDGIPDLQDSCPDRPEDVDGFSDADGCPEPDNDNDGVLDATDRCPTDPEDFDGDRDSDGCPDAAASSDDDKDGLVYKDDLCPDKAEEMNGVQDDDGCPETGPRVVRRGDQIFLLEEIKFAPGTSRIEPGSQALLDEAVKQLIALPGDKFIVVEGHTDNAGEQDELMRLSYERAVAVKSYLVQKGIPARQLYATGYGPSQPMASNRTERGRERNRRIVFSLQDHPGTTVGAP